MCINNKSCKPGPNNLRKIISAVVLLAVKDLQSSKHVPPSPTSTKEAIRTAWYLIFDDRYRMEFGTAKLSLKEMIDIICQDADDSIVHIFREAVKQSIQA